MRSSREQCLIKGKGGTKKRNSAHCYSQMSHYFYALDSSRMARAVATGFPHHVIQKGNYQQRVFGDNNEFRRHLGWLREYTRREFLKIQRGYFPHS